MRELLGVSIAFPTVVFTVLLGVVIFYWLLVFLGALSVNLLGGGDVGLDGHDLGLDGHDLGLDGHDLGLDGHGHDIGLDGPDADVDLDGPDMTDGTSLLGALKLRSAPATLVLSLLVTGSWLFSVLLGGAVHTYAPSAEGWLARLAILVLAPILALPVTSIAIRPLAPLFVVHHAQGHRELVGKIVTIRSGRVGDRFGEATFDDGAAGFIVQVRTDSDEGLARGDQALLVAWDETHDTFTVAPMKDLLAAAVQRDAARSDHDTESDSEAPIVDENERETGRAGR